MFYKTALYVAVERFNIEIIKLLLTNNKLDTNLLCIQIQIFFWHFGFYLCMELYYILSHKTAILLAFENESIEIIKILLTDNKINLNNNQYGITTYLLMKF